MITVALDSASDRCTVAAGDGRRVVAEALDGARRHAGAVLALLDAVLEPLGAAPADIGRLITADGPGSFTGLRVATSVAKALAWQRRMEWRVTPSLLVRAAAHAGAGERTVLALSDALRGQVYAGCWQFSGGGIVPREPPPGTLTPADLARFGRVDVVVGTVPDALVAAIEAATGRTLIRGESALPDARTMLDLADRPGGSLRVDDAGRWEPSYGRPAEAQVVWERSHGRPLDATAHHAR
jgi:tRNA threonylcarbamoyladenosine biosynthesis protein TsaB